MIINKILSTINLNNGKNTYTHQVNGSMSAIDLSICAPSICMDFHWDVLEDQPYHTPKVIKKNTRIKNSKMEITQS